MNYIKPNQIIWKEVPYLRQGESFNYDYTMMLNVPLADWDVWDYWERERVESMRTHLKKGDVLFDIGTEQGWCDLVYAKIVGAKNMVLVEPTPEFWPNIKALWEKNFPGIPPKLCFSGFFSDVSTVGSVLVDHVWPIESEGDLIDRNSYKNLFDPSHVSVIPQITVDDFVRITGTKPTALTIDVEGAELKVLKGAEKTLRENNIQVWVSEHPDMALRDYGVGMYEVSNFMKDLGYSYEFLAVDHETHVRYFK